MENVILESTYAPVDLFKEEKPFTIVCEKGIEITVGEGKAKAAILLENYNRRSEKIKEKFYNCLYTHCFVVFKKFNNKEYEISKPLATFPDGSKEISITFDTLADVKNNKILTDKNKKYITCYGRLLEKYYSDPALKKMMESFLKAHIYRENFFVYIYEIREILHKKIGKKENLICNLLGIKKCMWEFLGKKCNNDPRIGRHRGKNYNSLDKVSSPEDIKKVKSIAYYMIIKYVEYLENLEKRANT